MPPPATPPGPHSPKRIVAGILRRDRKILICQRARTQVQALRWEFPGGKLEAGESETAALVRELREELGVDAEIGTLVQRTRYRYSETGWLDLAFYDVTAWVGEPVNRVFEQVRWVQREEMKAFDFLEADRPLLTLLLAQDETCLS